MKCETALLKCRLYYRSLTLPFGPLPAGLLACCPLARWRDVKLEVRACMWRSMHQLYAAELQEPIECCVSIQEPHEPHGVVAGTGRLSAM
jgi:hypothetical protein